MASSRSDEFSAAICQNCNGTGRVKPALGEPQGATMDGTVRCDVCGGSGRLDAGQRSQFQQIAEWSEYWLRQLRELERQIESGEAVISKADRERLPVEIATLEQLVALGSSLDEG
jgi:hypothetical protein